MDKVVLGLSGGVDSAVSAVLLKKAGFDVLGLYMDITGDEAREDAVKTADSLGIPLKIMDIGDKLEENVCRPFADSYLRGETPNPCIMCNPSVKFPTLLEYADEAGAAYIATGHYARSKNGKLYKGKPSNDQSYMLCRLTEDMLLRTIFPLGDYEKSQVRSLAVQFGIPVADKPDSMEICFIPDKNHINWLSKRAEMPPEGDLVYNGAVIGRHNGIHRCTVGQRWPGLFEGKKLYVSEIRSDTDTIVLSEDDALKKTIVKAESFNWINGMPESEISGTVRVRHTKTDTPCAARVNGDTVEINCITPVRAPSPGQSAVLYEGDRVLGGGYIK